MNRYNMKRIGRTLFFVFLLLSTLTSCDSFLEEYSQDLAKVESWEDLDELLLGDGYLQTSRFGSNADIHDNLPIIHFMSDELKQNETEPMGDYLGYHTDMFSYFTWQRELGYNDHMKWKGGDAKWWDSFYTHINTVNQIIVEIDKQDAAREEDIKNKDRVKGEACFLRAAYYFLLVNLYGKPYSDANASLPAVPVKTTEYIQDIEYEKATVKETYDQILADLDMAEQLLEGKSRKSVYRADYNAVLLFKARVYLYMQNWQKAAEYAQKVLDRKSDLLNLNRVTEGTDCLYGSSPETIFVMGGYPIAVAFQDVHSTTWGTTRCSWLISDEMMALYDKNDCRTKLYIGKTEYAKDYPVLMKVSGQRSVYTKDQTVSDCFTLRTPEAYLIKAEANAYMGNDKAAQEALHTLLQYRMKTSEPVTVTGDDLVSLVRDENAREFLLEGHRWFDLRRYTVCKGHEYSKPIEHKHVILDGYYLDSYNVYRLEANDNAYTLPVPRAVSKFQVSLSANDRPDRKSIETGKY